MKQNSTEEEANEILRLQEKRSQEQRLKELENEDISRIETFFRWLEGQQRYLFYPLIGGVILWPFIGSEIGLTISGSAVVAAGAVPFITGRYRTRFMRLYGLPARLRGIFSMAMGAFVIFAGFAI